MFFFFLRMAATTSVLPHLPHLLPSASPSPTPLKTQVAVDISHHANLLALHRRVTTRDAVVGWFATSPQGALPSGGDALIHDFYSRECGPSHLPVHVTIDTSLTGSSVRICAYSGRSLSLGNAAPAAAAASTSAAAPAAAEPASPGEAGAAAAASAAAPPSPSPSAAPRPSPKTLATAFVEIPFKVITADAERLGARLLTTELVSPAAPRAAAPAAGGGAEAAATASLDASLERLVSMLESGSRWCSRVAAGEAAPDPAAAAGLADALAALAPLPAPEVEQLVAGATQDAMLLLYLSKLVSAHVTLSDRLGTASLPIL